MLSFSVKVKDSLPYFIKAPNLRCLRVKDLHVKRGNNYFHLLLKPLPGILLNSWFFIQYAHLQGQELIGPIYYATIQSFHRFSISLLVDFSVLFRYFSFVLLCYFWPMYFSHTWTSAYFLFLHKTFSFYPSHTHDLWPISYSYTWTFTFIHFIHMTFCLFPIYTHVLWPISFPYTWPLDYILFIHMTFGVYPIYIGTWPLSYILSIYI